MLPVKDISQSSFRWCFGPEVHSCKLLMHRKVLVLANCSQRRLLQLLVMECYFQNFGLLLLHHLFLSPLGLKFLEDVGHLVVGLYWHSANSHYFPFQLYSTASRFDWYLKNVIVIIVELQCQTTIRTFFSKCKQFIIPITRN